MVIKNVSISTSGNYKYILIKGKDLSIETKGFVIAKADIRTILIEISIP